MNMGVSIGLTLRNLKINSEVKTFNKNKVSTIIDHKASIVYISSEEFL
jgi:hypothetical protein